MVQQIVADSPDFTTTYEQEPIVNRDGFGYAEVRYGRLSRTVRVSDASVRAAIAELKSILEMEATQ